MKPYTYLLINMGCILVPLFSSFYPRRAFYKEWKAFFFSNFIIALLFLVWDYFFTLHGFWGFNPDYLVGLYIAGLPIEEILFFVCIPYACVFTYFILSYLIGSNPLAKYQKGITLVLMGVLLVTGLMTLDKWYTSMTALLTFSYLLFLWIRKTNLAFHYLSYFLVLPFFFLSNGLLTGSFLDAPIVWYNDAQNLGIRISTIPIEDICYGFLLIVMHIDFFDYFRKSSK